MNFSIYHFSIISLHYQQALNFVKITGSAVAKAAGVHSMALDDLASEQSERS